MSPDDAHTKDRCAAREARLDLPGYATVQAALPRVGEEYIDLFAGPGGVDVAASSLGVDMLGVEYDDSACATRRAAGHRTLQADVAALDPLTISQPGRLIGMWASPPCQSFSMAGKGEGRKALATYVDAISVMARGEELDGDGLDEACGDPRGHLVLEPLRWTLALRPRWVALEQVEPVLPLWEAMAAELRSLGYQTWTGVCSSERFGVPQTRRRAFLIASLDGPVSAPVATHQRYIAPATNRIARKAGGTLGLFAEADVEATGPERIVVAEDRHLLPWVSMAEALGWAPSDRYLNGTHDHRSEREASEPAPTLHFGQRLNTVVRVTDDSSVPWDPSDQVGFPRSADTPSNRATGRVEIDGTEYRERDLRRASEPAFVLTEKTRSWVRFCANDRSNATERSIDEPAPTITAGHDHGERAWIVDTGNTRRVTLAEALVLQSFAPDYPVQGTKTNQFMQVGNAVPPLLAWAVLRAVCTHGDDVPSPSDLTHDHDDMGGRWLPCGPAGLVPFDADLPVVDGEVPF